MPELSELLEYGEVRIWRCYNWYYAELIFEIPAGEIRMIQARETSIEEAINSLLFEIRELAQR